MRNLQEDDYERGFFALLDELVHSETLSKEQFLEILHDPHQDSLVVVLIEKSSQRILGSFKLLFEKKFILGGCTCAYLEEVIVSKSQRGKGYGKILMQTAVDICKERKCHRITGMGDQTNVGFYLQCGFKQDGLGIQIFFNK